MISKNSCKVSNNITIKAGLIIILNLFFACGNNDAYPSFIYGQYRLFSNDPSLQQFTSGENTFIEIGKNQTIFYNSTINNKPKFNFSGSYKFNKETNTLTIEWKEGKLPAVLKIDTVNNDYIIRIGETQYKKEKK